MASRVSRRILDPKRARYTEWMQRKARLTRAQTKPQPVAEEAALPHVQMAAPHVALLTVPGFTFDDIDRHGVVNQWKTAKLSQWVQQQLYQEAGPDSAFQRAAGRASHHLVSARYTFSPGYYNSKAYYNNMHSQEAIAKIDGNSLVHWCSVASPTTGEEMHQGFFKLLFKDGDKPAPISSDVRNQVTNEAGLEEEGATVLAEVTPLERPITMDTLQTKYRVMWSDFDSASEDNEVNPNQQLFLRICNDAIVDAVRKDKLNQLSGDFATYRVSELSMLHQGSCEAGDCLELHVWQEAELPNVVHCQIDSDGKHIFQCSIHVEDV